MVGNLALSPIFGGLTHNQKIDFRPQISFMHLTLLPIQTFMHVYNISPLTYTNTLCPLGWTSVRMLHQRNLTKSCLGRYISLHCSTNCHRFCVFRDLAKKVNRCYGISCRSACFGGPVKVARHDPIALEGNILKEKSQSRYV